MPQPTPTPQPTPDPDGRPGPHDPPGPRPSPGSPPPEIPDHLKPPRRGAGEEERPPNLVWSEPLGMLVWRADEIVTRRTSSLVGVHGFCRVGGGAVR